MPDVTEISNGKKIERPFTADERQQAEQDLLDGAAAREQADAITAAAAKARASALKKLAALGLTDAEVAALVGG